MRLRKFIPLVVSLAMVSGLSGCASSPEPRPVVSEETTSSALTERCALTVAPYVESLRDVVASWDQVVTTIGTTDHGEYVDAFVNRLNAYQALLDAEEAGLKVTCPDMDRLAMATMVFDAALLQVGVMSNTAERMQYQNTAAEGRKWLNSLGVSDLAFATP